MKPQQHTDRITLAAVPTAVGCSRIFVRSTLRRWMLTHLIDTTELLASELATNAVKATGAMEPLPAWVGRDIGLIHLRLSVVERLLCLSVWDCDHNPPALQEQSHGSEGGQGLLLVEQLSTRWSFYHPQSGGKIIWCEQYIAPPSPTPMANTAPTG